MAPFQKFPSAHDSSPHRPSAAHAASVVEQSRRYELRHKLWIAAAVIAALVGVGLLIWLVLPGASWIAYYYSFQHFFDILTSQGGVDAWLARAVSVVLAAVVFFGAHMAARKKHRGEDMASRRKHRRIGLVLLFGADVAFNLLMFFCTRGATAVDDKQLFVRETSKPRAWYSIDDRGDWELFNGPGSNPHSGQELQPMTPEAVQQYDAWKRQKDELSRHQAEELQQQSRINDERSFGKRLLNSANPPPGAAVGPSVIIAWRTESPDPAAATVESAVSTMLAKKGRRALTGALKPAFFAGGSFDEVWNGDQSVVERLHLLATPTSSLLLGTTKLSAPTKTDFDGLLSVQGTVSIIVIDAQGRRGPFVFSAAGVGADQSTAAATCARRLAEAIDPGVIFP